MKDNSDSKNNVVDEWGYILKGIELRKKGDLTEALLYFNKAIEINKLIADAYIERGNTKRILKDFHGALDDYDKAIEINPEDAISYNNRGFVKGRFGDHTGAINDFNRAINIIPTDSVAYINRGFYKGKIGDLQGAIEDYDEASKNDQKMQHNDQTVAIEQPLLVIRTEWERIVFLLFWGIVLIISAFKGGGLFNENANSNTLWDILFYIPMGIAVIYILGNQLLNLIKFEKSLHEEMVNLNPNIMNWSWSRFLIEWLYCAAFAFAAGLILGIKAILQN